MWSAILIREARLRAGLTQQELADHSGRKRSVIARWERGAIEPSLETFLEIIGVCGFELPLELTPRDNTAFERIAKNAVLSPERRLRRLVKPARSSFDPYAILAALERHHVSYVVIGAFARMIQGAEETTDGLDVAPSLRGESVHHLALALADLGAIDAGGDLAKLDRQSFDKEPVGFSSPSGTIRVVPEPAGTRGGYDDLRRAATREPIGKGLRIMVASTADLARMLAALRRETDLPKLIALRRLQVFEQRGSHELTH